MSNKIIIPAICTASRRLVDKSINIMFNTPEPSREIFNALDSFHQVFGFLMFKDSQIQNEEVNQFDELEADLMDKEKTPSKRFRAVLFVNWKQNNKGYEEFKDFYSHEMEKIITHYKSKLE